MAVIDIGIIVNGFAAAIALVLGAGRLAVGAAPADRLVVNPHTGLAISGFDPVAYFTRQQAVLGRPDLELTHNGAVWRFFNEGDRAAFAGHPDVYTPRFGGYDPVDVARGVTVAGNPWFWVVTGQRLYLFGFETNRDAFVVDPQKYLEKAQSRWPALEQGLAQ